MAFHYLIYCFILNSIFGEMSNVFAVNLKAQFAAAKLPWPVYFTEPIYDQQDIIYIFGGRSPVVGYRKEILRYDIETDSIEVVAELAVGGSYKGTVQWVGNDIYYFRSRTGSEDIIKFDPATNTVTKVGTLPIAVLGQLSSFKEQNSTTAYIFSYFSPDSGLSIYETNLSTLTFRTVNETIPFKAFSSVVINNSGYIFGDINQVLKVDMASLELTIVNATSGFDVFATAAVSDGVSAYMFGRNQDKAKVSSGYLLQFNPASLAWIALEVDNFPYTDDPSPSYDIGPGAVYVERLNRIYYFGGVTTNTSASQYRDDIWYIELTPGLSCLNKPDGMYPDPVDCSKFIWCNEGLTTEFDCPSPLLFDPLTGTCGHPDSVDCEVGCTGKEDGSYPHPLECSKFILCHQEILEVYDCPPPLLFDPKLFICNDPDLVDCSETHENLSK